MRLADWNFQERIDWVVGLMSRNIDFKDKSVLDIGCNTGHFACAAYNLGAAHVTCLDRNKTFINQTRKNVRELMGETCTLIESEIFDYEFKQFDIIICCGVIYHVERQLELLQRIHENSKFSVIEGMMSENEDLILELNCLQKTPQWIPSKKCYEKFLKFARLKTIDSEVRGRRICCCLKSSHITLL